jgi:hypothetical protein
MSICPEKDCNRIKAQEHAITNDIHKDNFEEETFAPFQIVFGYDDFLIS